MKYGSLFLRILLALLVSTPLLALAGWAYVDARAYRYFSASELLEGNYSGAAERLSDSTLVLGLLPLAGIAMLLIAVLSWRSRSAGGAAVAGAATGLLLVYPGFVPAVLGGGWGLAAIAMLCGGAALLGVVHTILLRLPACAAPVAALMLLLGISWSTTTANDIALRSNPPLAVLAAFADNPQNADNRLRMGLHLWSLGGAAEARPYLLAATAELEQRYTAAGAVDLANAARLLATRVSTLSTSGASPVQGPTFPTEDEQ